MRRRRLFRAIMIVGAVTVVALILEITSRGYIILKNRDPSAFFTQYCEIHDFRPHDTLGFEMAPGLDTRHNPRLGTIFSTDARGLRRPSVPMERQPGIPRLALVGGSCVFGFGAQRDATTLNVRLAEMLPGPVEAINAGQPGYTSWQMLRRFQDVVLPMDPDVAILYSGWNDLFVHAQHEYYDRERYHHRELKTLDWQGYIEHCNRGIEPDWLRAWAFPYVLQRLAGPGGIGWLRHRAPPRARSVSPDLADQILQGYQTNVEDWIAACRAAGTRPVLVTLFSEYLVPGRVDRRMTGYLALHKRINDTLRDLAGRHEVLLVDSQPVVNRGQAPDGVNNPGDLYHLTDAGNRFLANLVARTLEQVRWRESLSAP